MEPKKMGKAVENFREGKIMKLRRLVQRQKRRGEIVSEESTRIRKC